MATISSKQLIFAKKQFAALEKLATMCGVENVRGKDLYSKLRRLEKEAHEVALKYSNGDISHKAMAEERVIVGNKVLALFNNNLKGLLFNTEARGYTLKIEDDINNTEYREANLHRDMGGYGILAPDYSS